MKSIISVLQSDPYTRSSHHYGQVTFTGSRPIMAMHKSQSSPSTNSNPVGSEVAAYLVARHLRIGYLVPPTVRRLVDSHPHSFQQWLPPEWHHTIVNKVRRCRSLRDLVLLDTVIANRDRHPGNYLITSPTRIRAIDNAYSFAEDDGEMNPFNVHSPYKNIPLSTRHRQLLQTFFNNIDTITLDLRPYLSDTAIDRMFQRVARILNTNLYFTGE